MLYLYKHQKWYIYKRRIPKTNKFFTFQIKISNYKKVKRVALSFNKLSYNLFEEIKRTKLVIDENEVYLILNQYKDRALEENTKYERSRHKHFGDLFKITESDPLKKNLN